MPPRVIAVIVAEVIVLGGCWVERPGAGPLDLGRSDRAVAPFDFASPDRGGGPTTPGCGRTFCRLLAGSFLMGSPPTEPCHETRWGETSRETLHLVTLSRPFEIGRTETTRAQFSALMGYDPSRYPDCGATCPVENVSWHEAAAYCATLSAQRGLPRCYDCTGESAKVSCVEATAFGARINDCQGYRLPTEAEWEYAYRAGTRGAFYSGQLLRSALYSCDSSPIADPIGWYSYNSGATPHPVALKQPNVWGLHDMAGNVLEWVHDWHAADLGAAAVTDPTGPSSGPGRVFRSGGALCPVDDLRGAFRLYWLPGFTVESLSPVGFRCARTL